MRENVLTCICIILKRFIATDDVAEAGRLFCKYGILSQGQKKKFKSTNDTDVNFSKLYECVQKHDYQLLLDAIEDKEFPIDGEIRNIIKFLSDFEKEEWLLMIKMWDEGGLTSYKNELKLLAGPVPKKSDWVKPLLRMAFMEEVLDDDKRPVYDAIMSKLPIRDKTRATPDKSAENARELHKDENSNTEQSSSISNVGADGKRPDIEKETKRSKPGRKPRKTRSQKKNKCSAKGKVPEKVDASGFMIIPQERGIQQSLGNTKDETRHPENIPKSVDNNIPTAERERTGQHKFAVDIVVTSRNQTNTKENQVNSRNLKKHNKKPEENDSLSTKKNNVEKDVQNKAMPGARTRNESSESCSNMTDTVCTPARNDAWPQVFQSGERLLEIRAIVSRDSKLPPDAEMSMIFEDNKFQPVKMAYNERKEFYYFRVNCPVKYIRPFIYKFCFKDRNKIVYEYLPRDGWMDDHVNRMVDLGQVTTSWLIVLNVCTFRSNHNWIELCTKELERLLPKPDMLGGACHENENDSTSVTDVFCWLNCIKRGWMLHSVVPNYHCPHSHVYQEMLTNWLVVLKSYVIENRNRSNLKGLVTMALVVAISISNQKVWCKNLSLVLFQMLQVTELDLEERLEFMKELQNLKQYYENAGCDFPRFHEAIFWLYQTIPDAPNFEWILTLPLYWLLSNQRLTKATEVDCGKDFILYRSHLPLMKHGMWEHVRQSCMNASVDRKGLLEMIPNLLKDQKLHPWIIGAFQFMLNTKELAKLVHTCHEIVKHFQVDSTLLRYLEGYYNGIGMKMSKDETQSFDKYFKEVLQNSVSSEDSETRKCDVQTCLNMMKSICKYSLKYQSLEDMLWFVVIVLQKTIHILTISELNPKQKKEMKSMFTEFLRHLTKGIHLRDITKFEIQCWDRLLCTSWQSADISEQWRRELENEMKNSINNFFPKAGNKFLDFYVTALTGMELKSDLQKYFDDKAFEIAKCIMQRPDQVNWKKKFFEDVKAKLKSMIKGKEIGVEQHPIIKIFEQLFMKAYDKERKVTCSDETKALLFMCNWSFSAQFYELFGKDFIRLFSSQVQHRIESVSNGFQTTVNLLLNDQILVEQIYIIANNEERFFQICEVMGIPKQTESSSVDAPKSSVHKSLCSLKKYHTVYKRTKGSVENFLQICNYVNFDDVVPHKDLEKCVQKKTRALKVVDLVNKSDRTSSTDFFGISDNELIEFNKMSFIKDSKKLFRDMFINCVNTLQQQLKKDFVWKDLLQAWDLVKEEIFELVTSVDSGILTLQHVSERFRSLAGNKDDIDLEVQLIYDFADKYGDPLEQGSLVNREQRQLQIYNAFKLQKANRAINIFLDIRELLQLQGDFSSIIKRKEMIENGKETHLYDVPETLEILEISEIDDAKLMILEKFMKGEKVIHWLQGKMKGIQGVQVLCDLAMISAGEDAIELGRVSCFLSAVMGFAPLIFWKTQAEDAGIKPVTQQPNQIDIAEEALKDIYRLFDDKYINGNLPAPDHGSHQETHVSREEAGLTHLLEKCNKVWEKAGNGDTLVVHWEETVRHLTWFEDVEKFYGSVEKSSLTRAQAINERGVYVIKNNSDAKKICPGNSLQLRISKTDEEDRAQVVMSLEALQELQSKLMLIAGDVEKVQRDVNHFVDVLTSVQKLNEAYVELKLSGCMLFSGWEASVDCNEGSDLIIRINFTPDHQLFGLGSHLVLDQVTQILKKTLHNWQEYVSAKRMEYYQLNEFNIDQIMYLCSQLSNLNKSQHVPDQVHTLLSFVTPGLEDSELKECVEHVLLEIDQEVENIEVALKDSLSDPEESTTDDEESGDSQVKVARLKLKAVRNLETNERVAVQIAKAAVEAEGYTDFDKCLEWILLNEFEDELIETLNVEFDRNCQGLAIERKEAKVVHSAFKISSNNTLNEVIARLQESVSEDEETKDRLLNSVQTICKGYIDDTVTMNLQDHLSIPVLGKIISRLRKSRNIHRELLSGLTPGRPNLLICNKNDILPTVISIYMKNLELPLPTRSEVLICTEDTSKDELERFFRRAICERGDEDQLIHTLAFADNLSFSTSMAVDGILTKLKGSNCVNIKYQLVILLNKQQHTLATYFDKFVVDGKWLRPIEDIQNYLKTHLTVLNHQTSAASMAKGHYNVKVISSARSGVGKSLYAQRLKEEFEKRIQLKRRTVTLRLLDNELDFDYVIEKLCSADCSSMDPLVIHIDMTPAVLHGIQSFSFNLFVLGSIQGCDGRVWMRQSSHLYLVEATDFSATGEVRFSKSHILNLLPSIHCCTPFEFLNRAHDDGTQEWMGMDRKEFESETFQRPFQYLSRYQQGLDLNDFSFTAIEGDEEQCVRILLDHCHMQNPSWAQLRHFSSFLNFQLRNCENSVFCSHWYFKPILLGLKLFAVRFMIKMAQDFATPSLTISDTSVKDAKMAKPQGFEAHQLRRKWEEDSHPYVFFNEDGHSMTFVNVKIDRQGNLLDTNDGIVENIITPQLTTDLHQQGFNLRKNFDDYPRQEKLRFMCQVLGIDVPFDPDPTYELTTDNVLKILAIYTRFKCGIPVIIMGETGCGKTRLVEFMSKLKGGKTHFENMTTLKIHGGITVKNIHERVSEAILMEKNSAQNFTVLFFDEANTTEGIYAIKEVMCDRSIDGNFFQDSNLNLVAACNPYKKLSERSIKKLEDSGLGYRIHTSKTTHLFGNIPVRSLVYRVVALPPSMQPFVWDFGQLSNEAEMVYIQQMCQKMAATLQLCQASLNLLVKVLSCCQKFMRSRTDECRYVSLRDVERCITTFEWFHRKGRVVYPLIEAELDKKYQKMHTEKPTLHDDIRTVIQTVGVCYYASLDDRGQFLQELEGCLSLPGVDSKAINMELICCQAVFLRNIQVGNNIACNQALRENVFMMAVCMDMRIPLFLVGKPGSSKSLAKTIIQNNMLGEDSHAPVYQNLKKVHILSYQCSALTNADGIQRVFNQCIQLQQKQNIETYTAVVVLDEIGLAEDSPNMPLKILHPLLERRSAELKTVAHGDSERVGFVGISNWALDPAKMNRGIFLTRNKPNEDDLKKTGREIFQGKNSLWRNNEALLSRLTSSYIEMYGAQGTEYFGLRDYYSLMKMICTRSNDARERISIKEVAYAVYRNFGGGIYEVVEKFLVDAENAVDNDDWYGDPVLPIQQMIEDNLSETDSRFLLLLTNQFSIVSLLRSIITKPVQIVFGSSFPGDHNYTEICRNINKIKVCMETGKTVILLNMSKIHESLYDALNQHFVSFGGQNYVDLGLGGHRVKCRIAKDFRLIVIEKTDVVKKKYPIPLINRLEKHHFSSENLLDHNQREKSQKLNEWMSKFTSAMCDFSNRHTFIGCHSDSASSVVLTTHGQTLSDYQRVLLQTCSMDAISRLRNSQHTEDEIQGIEDIYFNQQRHDSLANLLEHTLHSKRQLNLLEITSFSGGLWERDVVQLEQLLGLSKKSISLIPLEYFETQEEYCNELQLFFVGCSRDGNKPLIALIQCSQAQKNSSLIACARHCLLNKVKDFQASQNSLKRHVTIALLLSMEREGTTESPYGSLALQHTKEMTILHVDDFRWTDDHISPASRFFNKSLHQVFQGVQNGGEGLLSMKSLFLDSVPECVTKVKDDNSDCDRYSKRVEILKTLFGGDGAIEKSFQSIFLDKIREALKVIDSQLGHDFSWVVEEANNGENLQEGGTFRKTLWLCLKKHVSKLMACVLSVADERNNMDIVVNVDATPFQQNMWIDMFKMVLIDWENMLKSSTYVIVGRKQLQNSSCQIPFSFLLFDYLQGQWMALQSQGFKSEGDMYPQIFTDCPLRKAVVGALQNARVDVMNMLVRDLVATWHHFGTSDDAEFDVVCTTLFEFSIKNFKQLRSREDFAVGDEVGVIFCTFKMIAEKLEKFSQIIKGCPDILKNHEHWISQQQQADDIILHHLALKDAIGTLRSMAEGIENFEKCISWIDQVRIIKQLYKSTSTMIKDEAILKTINNNWIPLQILDLLLQQLLPPADITSEFYRKVVKTIAPPAKLFWRGTVNKDSRSLNFFKIVLNVLKKCSTEIELQLKLGWRDNTHCNVCQRKVCNPALLPCSHFLCEKCVPKLIPDENGITRCSTCHKNIPENYDFTITNLTPESVIFCQRMKFNSTSFFIECLEQFCFRHEGKRPPMEQQIELVFNEIILEVVNGDRPQLDSTGLDLNINFKSFVFQILLKYNQQHTTSLVQKYLETHSVDHLHFLTTVILKAYQQKVSADMAVFEQNIGKQTRHWHQTLPYIWRELSNTVDQVDLSTLENINQVRCSLYHLAFLIEKHQKHENVPECSGFMEFCRSMLTDDVLPVKEFLIKVGYKKYGKQWLFQLAKDEEFNVFIPPHLRQSAAEKTTDFWALLGQEYIHTKSLLYQNQPEDYESAVAGIFNSAHDNFVLPQILAVLTWMGNTNDKVKATLMEVLQFKCVNYRNFLSTPFRQLQQMIDDHVATQHNSSLLNQLTVFTLAAIRSSSNGILSGFCNILDQPMSTLQTYLPTMPENRFFLMPPDYRLENQQQNSMYTCPKGHLYSIGNCTQPAQLSSCPECKSQIGGAGYQPAEGNQKFTLTTETQAGYKHGNNDVNHSTGSERMSLQGFAATQYILHSCLLAASLGSLDDVARVLQLQPDEVPEFLILQLEQNLLDLSKGLARNIDESTLIMFSVLLNIIKQDQKNYTENWQTMESRRVWELTFRQGYLRPIFQNIDGEINRATHALKEDEHVGAAPLRRLVNDVDEDDGMREVDEEWQENFTWIHPSLWRTIDQQDSAHLIQVLEDAADDTPGDVLQIILKTEDLQLVKHLGDVLTLQQYMVSRYRYRLDLEQANETSLRQNIMDWDADVEILIEKYINAWNQIYQKLKSVAPEFLHEYFEEMSLDSPLCMVLPSLTGPGQCAKLLTEYLIETQNHFLEECIAVIKPHQTLEEVEIRQLHPTELVCIDKSKDLIGMIGKHTSYKIHIDDDCRRHETTYNVEALEKQVREKYVLSKKLIKKHSLSYMKYPQDVGIGTDWKAVMFSIKQAPLTAALQQKLDSNVACVHSAELCEAVRILTNAISFLAMVKSPPQKKLQQFLEKDLKIFSRRIAIIPGDVEITHTLSLYQRLTWHKAVIFVKQGLHPYKEALAAVKQEPIPDGTIQKTQDALEKIDTAVLQQRMNEILITGVATDEARKADWSLVEDVFPYIQLLDDSDDDSWYIHLPEELCNKHLSHLFQLTVLFR